MLVEEVIERLEKCSPQTVVRGYGRAGYTWREPVHIVNERSRLADSLVAELRNLPPGTRVFGGTDRPLELDCYRVPIDDHANGGIVIHDPFNSTKAEHGSDAIITHFYPEQV